MIILLIFYFVGNKPEIKYEVSISEKITDSERSLISDAVHTLQSNCPGLKNNWKVFASREARVWPLDKYDFREEKYGWSGKAVYFLIVVGEDTPSGMSRARGHKLHFYVGQGTLSGIHTLGKPWSAQLCGINSYKSGDSAFKPVNGIIFKGRQ